MAGELIWAFRVMRLPLRDAGGQHVGRVNDIVVVPGEHGDDPRVVGFVADSQRRRIFVSANRVAELANDGMRLRSWDVDLRPFRSRPGEILVGDDLLDRKLGDEAVSDVGLRQVERGGVDGWELVKVRLVKRNLLRRKPSFRLVDADQVPGLFAHNTEEEAEAARLRDLHPAEVANIVRSLPLARRRLIAAAMDDERLADVLEELPEQEQISLIVDLDLDRLLDVLDEMEFDDLADLLGEMSTAQRSEILEAMDADDADVVRRLLAYEAGTAGGLMTPEVIILPPTATVADALAQLRSSDWVVSIAAQVFVCQPPFKPPTGKLIGTAHFQRLLREPPSTELGDCVYDDPVVAADATDRAVAELLARYDMVAVAVCDESGRMLGAVTIDDVLDRQLGTTWRQRNRMTTSRMG